MLRTKLCVCDKVVRVWESIVCEVCVCVKLLYVKDKVVCVYTVITNGFSSCHRSCTIQNSRGQRYPCHFLCQRS